MRVRDIVRHWAMPGRRSGTIARCPVTGKVSYENRGRAERCAEEIYAADPRALRQGAYLHPECGSWHLTKSSFWRTQRAAGELA